MKTQIFLFVITILLIQGVAAQTETIKDSLTVEEIERIRTVKKRKLGTALSQLWELDDVTKRGTFKLITYQPNYVMPFRWTDNFNRRPVNENPLNGQPEYKPYQDVEAKFQVSLRSKIMQDVFWGKGDFWVGFTQVSYWQVYNAGLSRPFREINYEPEVMFVMPLNMSIKDFRWRMIAVSLNHQSNGKEQELSRSWNRIILTTFYEWNDVMFNTRTIFRLPENDKEDDNPNILDYVGRWEFGVAYNAGGGHIFRGAIRNNLSFKRNRTHIEATYVFPFMGGLKGLLQVSHGYGDSLIEYNHRQSNVGIGLVFLEL